MTFPRLYPFLCWSSLFPLHWAFISNHVLDEAERSLHDALCVLTQTVKETRVVPGGGCTEIAMAAAIDAEVRIFRGIFVEYSSPLHYCTYSL